jgi:sterol desaturase/sphingolipid hydroxylase (fatty acid hydroxylase superfamily)
MMIDYIHQAKDLLLMLMIKTGTDKGVLAVLAFLSLVFLFDLHRRGYRFSWPRRLVKSAGVNISFLFVNSIFAPLVYILTKLTQSGYDALGIPSIDTATWDRVPPWLLTLFAVFCYDLANYWNHRLMHMSWLWPVHAIHHSDPEVNGLTGYRIHFLEALIMALSYVVLLSWLGFPSGVIGAGGVLIGLHNAYVHLNLDWGHGPFRLLIASPRFHRWHHADVPQAYGKNLANIFPFLDVLFGTYRVPGPCDVPLGAQGVPENDIAKLHLFPFAEWARMAIAPLRRVRAKGRASESSSAARLQDVGAQTKTAR